MINRRSKRRHKMINMALPILLQPVRSQMLSEMGYLPASRTLFVRFRNNGSVYAYIGVPPALYRELAESGSIGRFMQQRIMGHFYAARISRGPEKNAPQAA